MTLEGPMLEIAKVLRAAKHFRRGMAVSERYPLGKRVVSRRIPLPKKPPAFIRKDKIPRFNRIKVVSPKGTRAYREGIRSARIIRQARGRVANYPKTAIAAGSAAAAAGGVYAARRK